MGKQFFSAIFDTVKQSSEIVAEGLDVAVDAVLDSDLLSHVPVISVAVKSLKIKDEFVLQRLRRNCKAFLDAVKDTDRKKIEQMRLKLEETPEQLEEFADTTMSVLLEGQKPIKSTLIGRLMGSLAEERIDLAEFQALSQLIQAGAVPAILSLRDFFETSDGLAYRRGLGQIVEEPLLMSLGFGYRSGNMFRISELGQTLYKHGFGGIVREA